MFSVLYPGAYILPHRCADKGTLRYHLGLSIPKGEDCFISIENIKYYWNNGEGFFFDDTRLHYVKNDTDEIRIILFCGITRPMNIFGKIINKIALKITSPFTYRYN